MLYSKWWMDRSRPANTQIEQNISLSLSHTPQKQSCLRGEDTRPTIHVWAPEAGHVISKSHSNETAIPELAQETKIRVIKANLEKKRAWGIWQWHHPLTHTCQLRLCQGSQSKWDLRLPQDNQWGMKLSSTGAKKVAQKSKCHTHTNSTMPALIDYYILYGWSCIPAWQSGKIGDLPVSLRVCTTPSILGTWHAVDGRWWKPPNPSGRESKRIRCVIKWTQRV